ncbi:MAG: PEP-CTERM sorting domain-containing protein [Phycisphaerales bacterium]|nr:PEP-CTERM sorting domain-containing protein [Phycisphaerales bacterium]
MNDLTNLMTASTHDSLAHRRCLAAATIAAALLVSASANADIIGWSSTGVHGPYTMTSGDDLRLNKTEDNTRSWVFREQQNVGLPSTLVYNAHKLGRYTLFSDLESGSPIIPGDASSLANSYIFHFDPTSGVGTKHSNGYVDFDREIYVITKNNDLDDSDGLLGVGQYPGRFSPIADRGYDMRGTEDWFDISNPSPNVWRLEFGTSATTGMDQLRVVETWKTPAPSSLALLGLGGMVAVRRRR